MHSPELYIFIALGFAFGLSWIVSKFEKLPIDLFNTSIGLLFGASANLALMASKAQTDPANEIKFPALMDYAILLVFLQFAFGILTISSYFAHKKILESEASHFTIKLKETLFYTTSSLFSLFCCYVMAVFFLHSETIFAPLSDSSGELIIIINRWADASFIPAYLGAAVLLTIALARYWRENINQLAKP